MFPIDKKKTAMVILSKMGKDQEVKEEESSDESMAMYEAFAEDIMQAVNDKSVMSLAAVLKSFHEMIEEQDEAEDAKQ
jgi:hypothetical protein